MTPARVCAEKISLNKNTVDLWYQKIRKAISELPEPEKFSGKVEIDESYFGKKRAWIQGTGSADKVSVFGIRERETENVWCTVTEGTDHTYLLPIIEWRVEKGTTIYSDGFGAYKHLHKLGYTHYILLHSKQEYSRGNGIHTNGIEIFWVYAKKLTRSRKGLRREDYHLHLREASFRFNNWNIRIMRLIVRDLL
jgi:transposase